MITLNLARGDNYESVPLRLPSQRHDPPEWFGCWEIYVSPAGHSSTTHQE